MTDPTHLAAARRACERLGYQLNTPESVGADAIAWPGDGATPVPGGRHGPRPMGVEFVDGADPAATLSTLANAMHWNRTCLLVARDAGTAEDLVDVLSGPVGARGEDELGARRLYAGPDRVHLDGGGLALYDGGIRRPDFEWFEESADGGDRGGAGPGAGSDDRRLVCSVDGSAVAVLDGVDDLRCPGPPRESFGLRYERGEDRLFHVFDADGREVGVFSGVRAMRDRGFHPVPAPVVPEHVLPGRATSAWAVLDPERDRLFVDGGELELPEA
jgi:hypothetical protein